MPQNKIVKLFVDSYSGISRGIWLLSFVTLIYRAGAMILPFLSLYLTAVEGYSLSTAGIILLFYGIGSFFGNYFGGILTDIIGAFRLQFLSLISTAIAFMGLLLLHSPVSMAIGLFVTSLLVDTFRPANMASVGVLVGKEKRTKAVGVLRLAINIGFAAGPASGGLIAYSLGYELLFIIDAITCCLAALFLLYFFRKQIKAEGKKKEFVEGEIKPSVKQVLNDRVFLKFLFLQFFMGIVFMQFFNTEPVFLKQNLNLNEGSIGFLMAFNGVLVVLLELPMIHTLEKFNSIKLIAIGCVIQAACYFVYIYESWQGVAIVSVFFFTIGEILILPFATSAILNRAPENLRGRYMAFYGMAFSICHIVSPVIGMQIADNYNFTTLWLFITSLSLLTGLGYWKLRKTF